MMYCARIRVSVKINWNREFRFPTNKLLNQAGYFQICSNIPDITIARNIGSDRPLINQKHNHSSTYLLMYYLELN
jgi:hypothetical protein